MRHLPDWLQALVAVGPLLTFLGVIGAGILAFFTLRQRSRADARSHW